MVKCKTRKTRKLMYWFVYKPINEKQIYTMFFFFNEVFKKNVMSSCKYILLLVQQRFDDDCIVFL